MTIEYARKLVSSYVYNVTPDKIEQIAQRMLEQDEGVWHAASVIFGTLDRCPCAPCTIKRRERV